MILTLFLTFAKIGLFTFGGGYAMIPPMYQDERDFLPLILAAALAVIFFGSREFLKKKMSPIVLIVILAGMGILAYGV